MQSPEATRRSTPRRKPDLNIDTSAAPAPKASRDRDTIPQTPPGRLPLPASSKAKPASASGGRALKVPTSTRDADMETFLESLTPDFDVPNSDGPRSEQPRRPNPRDSHDLSLSPRQVTRDSLVANMLLSLDQFSMGQTTNSPFGPPRSGYDDPPIYPQYDDDDRRAMTFNSRAGRGNNGHSYSYSSDMEGPDDASRISSRGRRSNSSSGFQSTLARINSVRETNHQRSMPSTPKQPHTRGGRGSKSSSTNSIDAGYAQVLGSQRWARGFGGRSSSFDGDPRPVPAPSVSQSQPQSPWHIEFSNSFFNDGYDAAPTPTIPAGPRRLATVPSLPVMPPPEPKVEPNSPVVERRRSTRSSRSVTLGRKTESKYLNTRDVPPVPALDLDSAPAPHVGYEKSKDAGISAAGTQQPKDKPGFFRRMFGSSKANSPSVASSPQASSSSVDMSGSRSHQFASQGKSSAPPSRESHQSATHTLQKKTSAFFRRRKISITDSEPPPIPAVPALPTVKLPTDRVTALSSKTETSPITSLRRAMDPFLQQDTLTPKDAVTPTEDMMPSLEGFPPGPPEVSPPPLDGAEAERRRNARGFSPDYEPSSRALIRAVDPSSAENQVAANHTRSETPNRPAPEAPKNSPPKSFLQDNSDSEDSPKRSRNPAAVDRRDENLKPGTEADRRTRSPSPMVSKAKSVPNLGKTRDEKRIPLRPDPKSYPGPHPTGNRDSRSIGLPIEGILTDGGHAHSPETRFKHPPSLPCLRVDSAEPSPSGQGTNESIQHSSKSIDEPEFVVGEPTEDDRQKARKIFDGSEDFIQKEKAAAWMGEEGIVRQRTLRAYMDLFDFENQTIVTSLRQVCQRLLLRAETQQVDRILVAFSRRWCECNPNHGFKAADIIHTICYSIILLNTDLHMADIEHKMTRSQFIKNTMTTIRQCLQEVVPSAFDRPSILPGKGSSLGVDGDSRTSGDRDRHNSFRASFMPPPRPGSALGAASEQLAGDGCGPLVKAPFEGPLRGWEGQVEIVLKEIYASIRDDSLPLFGAETTQSPTQGGLTVMGMLKRSPSVLSKAPSEGVASVRGRIPDTAKTSTSRWNSKSRSRPRGFGTGFSSSRTSFEDANSMWSPTESSATWSRASLGRTHTSMSMDSFGSSYPRGEFQQSIGFASALSQAIIREDNTLDANDQSEKGEDLKRDQLLDDESLELAGPPWVKEGIVTHKHHLDSVEKRAKDRNWTEVFAVIQKGQLSLFSFSPNKSLRSKGRIRGQPPKDAVVGGGNWQENATNLGTFSLQQTYASTLPHPGYSRSRPHVWALSLPSGAVHLFQVGTPEIRNEFVETVNYWSARLSTHPLVGGVSNIEYGWSDAIINNPLVIAISESNGPVNGRPSTGMGSIKGHSRPGSGANASALAAAMGRSSMQSRSSMRSSSFDFGRPGSVGSGVMSGVGSGSLPRHSKLPGDRIHISEWTPPTQSMRASTLHESQQLDYLTGYVDNINLELEKHNKLRSPMLLAFSPRSSNGAKAMANWERRSEYLLKERVKYLIYIDALKAAEVRKAEIYEERGTTHHAAQGEEKQPESTPKQAAEEGDEEDADETITLDASAA